MNPRSGDRSEHWDRIYDARGPSLVSWYQAAPTVAMELIESLDVSLDTPMIDVGGGASTLVDELLAKGFSDVSLLDISASALEITRERLGADARRVGWLREDVVGGWVPERYYGLWHDRAVFHFLVTEEERAGYRKALALGLAAGGVAIVASFASDGPERCSGLPVVGYGPEALLAALGNDLRLLSTKREEHRTPAGIVQPFTWVAARRG